MRTREECQRIAKIIRENTRTEAAKILGWCARTVNRWADDLREAGYDVGPDRIGGRHRNIPPNTEDTP